MEDYGSVVDVPSPSNSLYYVYGESEQYLDSNTSESHSPSSSAYDMTYAAELSNTSSVYPSPERDDEDSSQPSSQQKPAVKRKRENRYKNAPPSVLSRRRAQNRASQRAYRERKDQRIKDLEQMLNEAKQRNDVLGNAYATLHAEYMSLKAAQIKDQSYQAAEMGYRHPAMGGLPDGSEGLDLDLYVYSDMNAAYTL
ncbi:hypothetical protein B0T26DRAFT_178174 [Lasiosphaeria miniovina]|uniref:Putative transcription factor kapC n=1 Tax=Lasiosphaeria miniovina TaxID=1954250 RepID=A0AA40B6J4_9PEZI|nr:uncharacterized protein B0T26DRAFT_178174 [Lasiosphaeria miniovina]KAK0728593.1 hypothetical protein B0T26DRAFT_178174 [Lasiosphaeria miniovina]